MGVGGAVAAGVVGAAAVGLTVLTVPFVSPAFRRVCIPYVPASDQQLINVRSLLERCPQPLRRLIDLGSGDGRVVLECARLGYEAHGVELNLPLVLYSKLLARREGLHGKARFFRRDIFKTDLGAYDLAILFGTETMVDYFLPKLNEMREGSHVIMCRFPLPEASDWTQLHMEGDGIDTAWLYSRNSSTC